jgi:hypothetical protein
MKNPNASASFSPTDIIRLIVIISPILFQLFTLSDINRNTPTKMGSPISVNVILIEKIEDIGLIGKEYNPFPTK